MRYPAEQKAATHEKILSAAARSFREHGADLNGIGKVMKELGLTKGGFYKHFESKGDLYAQAVGRAFQKMTDHMIGLAEAAPQGQQLQAIIEYYLSVQHLDDPGTGCPLAALAPEVSRQPVAVRRRISQSMAAFRDRMVPYLPGRTIEEQRAAFYVLFPAMAGVVATARGIADPQGRQQILAAARSFYLKTFAPGYFDGYFDSSARAPANTPASE
jgi:TetR/AcrR family transcriptional regulator, transcriptional repressor for nem operon